MGKFFGTDGIRGIYGVDLTDELALLIGNAISTLKENVKIVIGRDTRISGEALSNNVSNGVIMGGGDVIDAGIIPTPTIAFLTLQNNADYGVVISASHNPPEYNGIKIFNNKGQKLAEKDRNIIEEFIINKNLNVKKNGNFVKQEDAYEAYIDKIVSIIDTSFAGHSVALDCADGAACTVATKIFKKLGADVLSYNDCGDGKVINCNKGALHPNITADKVKKHNFDIGFAFDGDADRLIAIDKNGNIIDGDMVIYAMANYFKSKGELNGNTVVGTLHTNLGIEKALENKGIKLIRTNIGDQYVAAEMIENDYLLGGEQSGHIILRKFLDTGDGIFAAAFLMKIMIDEKVEVENLTQVFKTPQINLNITVKDKSILENKSFLDVKSIAEEMIDKKGRILVRASGTEPKIRIMVEGYDEELLYEIANMLKKALVGEK